MIQVDKSISEATIDQLSYQTSQAQHSIWQKHFFFMMKVPAA